MIKTKKEMPANFKEAMQYFASMGGNAVSKKYGKEHFAKLGRAGMKVRWDNYRKEKAVASEQV